MVLKPREASSPSEVAELDSACGGRVTQALHTRLLPQECSPSCPGSTVLAPCSGCQGSWQIQPCLLLLKVGPAVTPWGTREGSGGGAAYTLARTA